MRKVVRMMVALVLLSSVAVFTSCVSCGGDKAGATGVNKACCKSKSVYVCTMCKTVAPEAGKCSKCGMALVKMHVLSCKDGVATLCACKTDCKCAAKGDGAKCGCGQAVVTVPMKDVPGCGACKAAAPKCAAPAPAAAKK